MFKMFKKALLLIGALILAGLILAVSLKSSVPKPSFAAATLNFSVSLPPATISAEQKVDYYMAYPGILPDHFLYKIKMVRDRIKTYLTSNLQAKVSLFLLYSDKRIGAGKILIEGNKVPLGLSTILKGEKYLEQAVGIAEKIQDRELLDKLNKACQKHSEIFTDLKSKLDASGIATMNELLKFNKLIQDKINSLYLQLPSK